MKKKKLQTPKIEAIKIKKPKKQEIKQGGAVRAEQIKTKAPKLPRTTAVEKKQESQPKRKGKPLSEETKAKISASLKKYYSERTNPPKIEKEPQRPPKLERGKWEPPKEWTAKEAPDPSKSYVDVRTVEYSKFTDLLEDFPDEIANPLRELFEKVEKDFGRDALEDSLISWDGLRNSLAEINMNYLNLVSEAVLDYLNDWTQDFEDVHGIYYAPAYEAMDKVREVYQQASLDFELQREQYAAGYRDAKIASWLSRHGR